MQSESRFGDSKMDTSDIPSSPLSKSFQSKSEFEVEAKKQRQKHEFPGQKHEWYAVIMDARHFKFHIPMGVLSELFRKNLIHCVVDPSIEWTLHARSLGPDTVDQFMVPTEFASKQKMDLKGFVSKPVRLNPTVYVEKLQQKVDTNSGVSHSVSAKTIATIPPHGIVNMNGYSIIQSTGQPLPKPLSISPLPSPIPTTPSIPSVPMTASVTTQEQDSKISKNKDAKDVKSTTLPTVQKGTNSVVESNPKTKTDTTVANRKRGISDKESDSKPSTTTNTATTDSKESKSKRAKITEKEKEKDEDQEEDHHEDETEKSQENESPKENKTETETENETEKTDENQEDEAVEESTESK